MKTWLKKIVVRMLTAEAALVIRRHQPTVVAVTGSVGKTSTKDAIYAAVKKEAHARKSEKSFNSDIGVPLAVLGLPNAWRNPFFWARNVIEGFFIAVFSRRYPSVLILEMGVDRPGDMEDLTRWINPDIVVLTRLPSVPVHVEYFSAPEAVVAEKMHLVSALKPDGVLVYNNDDALIQKQLPGVRQRQVGYGRYLDTDFTARADKVVYEDDMPVGTEFTVTHADESVKLYIAGTLGTQHVFAAGAALAVASELGVSLQAAATGVGTLATPPGRMRIIPGIKGTTIIDDTYNSSPIACEQALQALNEVAYTKRKIVVLGDMLELGKFSADEHLRIGSLVPATADMLITVGVRARHIAEGALAAGMSEKKVLQYEDVDRAGRELQTLLQAGDIVLVKASQSLRAERVVEEIMANPEQAADRLVRQDPAWKTIA